MSRFDHLVAIERSGRAADGNYYNMRGANIKHLVDPIDDLFVAAADIPGITTIGSLIRGVCKVNTMFSDFSDLHRIY